MRKNITRVTKTMFELLVTASAVSKVTMMIQPQPRAAVTMQHAGISENIANLQYHKSRQRTRLVPPFHSIAIV